ncbi:hypothetical protein ACJJTC_005753 [Scirpophaga incertulas]
MAENEERLTESNSNVNTISELPGRPFSITVELPLFLTMLGLALSGTAVSNIILYRTCVISLNHTVDECKVFLSPARKNETIHLEDEVQKYAAFVQMVKLVIESVVPAILSMFLGVWSDTHGRKPLIIWPLLGVSISSMLVVVYSMLENLGPWWYLMTSVPFSLTGGYSVLFTGAFCYLSDITTSSSRSLRMTLLETAISVGSVIGSVLSAYLLIAVGNIYLLLIVCSLYVLAYAFTNIYMIESLTGAIEGGFTTVLDVLLIKEMFRECFKRRPNHMRAQLLLLTVANSLSIFVLYGLFGLDYLYTREKLHWALQDFTMFSAVSTTISFLGAIFGAAVIQKILPINDLVFSMVSFTSMAAAFMIKAFAVTTWHMYLSSGVALFGALSVPLIRSTISKILPLEDIAKVFALMCAIDGVCPLLSPVLYNAVYECSITTLPGAVMILSGVFNVASAVMIGYVMYLRWDAASTAYQSLPEQS